MIDYTQMNESVQTRQPKAPHSMKHAESAKRRISESMKQRHARLRDIQSFIDNLDSPESSKMLTRRYLQLERQLQEDIKRVNTTSKNMLAILKLLPQFHEDDVQTHNAPMNRERFIEEVTKNAVDNFKKIITEKYTVENEQET